jgi:cytochrome c oxidase assembly protein subunit 15
MAYPMTQGPERPRSQDTAVRSWLFIVAGLVFAMIVVGGATRLTDSGLSITEWLPILGAIPPLSDVDWQVAFEKYKAIPEYSIVNAGMSLSEFKYIYWWEWAHRFLGRFIGVAFAIPFLGFWIAGMLRPGFGWKCLGVFVLGGLQGFIGWYMVKSGLVDRVDVSQYRLAVHLLIAFAILGLLIWLALDLAPDTQSPRLQTVSLLQRRVSVVLVVLVFVQSGLGALVAGLKAGLAYNTWPLMDGKIIPSGLGTMSPWFLNVFENVTTVQFNHRVMAYAIAVLAIWHLLALAFTADDERVVMSAALFTFVVLTQMALGIWMLLAHVPLWLGLVHQAGAAIVVAACILHLYRMTRSATRA